VEGKLLVSQAVGVEVEGDVDGMAAGDKQSQERVVEVGRSSWHSALKRRMYLGLEAATQL
jgi:hypothetical protein